MSGRRSNKSFKRKKYTREPNLFFMIICEGEKTEPNYFSSFRVKKEVVKIDIFGVGSNTDDLIEKAKDILGKKEKEEQIKFDIVWCVFDRDSFPAQNFNRALQLANNYGFKVAYSNEAFELWYILHFEFLDAGITREQYIEKLNSYLEVKYEKNSKDIYKILLSRQEVAIRNAKKLLERYNPPNPEQDKPSTTVHLLVEELNKYKI